MRPAPIRLVLVDDHRMFRSGVKAELDESMLIVGEAADVDSAIRRVADGDAVQARSYQYKEVAKELVISTKTVQTPVSSVLRKLQLSSRHELTAWAVGRHLL